MGGGGGGGCSPVHVIRYSRDPFNKINTSVNTEQKHYKPFLHTPKYTMTS